MKKYIITAVITSVGLAVFSCLANESFLNPRSVPIIIQMMDPSQTKITDRRVSLCAIYAQVPNELGADLRAVIRILRDSVNLPSYADTHSIGSNKVTILGSQTQEDIGPTLDNIIKAAGKGIWKKLDHGFIIYFGEAANGGKVFNNEADSIPPLELYCNDIKSACEFFSELFQVKLTLNLKNPGRKPEVKWPYTCSLGGGNPYVDHEGQVKGEIISFKTEKMLTREENLQALAKFYGVKLMKNEENEYALEDLTEREVEARVTVMMEDYRRSTSWSFTHRTFAWLEERVVKYLIRYLEDDDIKVVSYTVNALYSITSPLAKDSLLKLLEKIETHPEKWASGSHVDSLREGIIRNLILLKDNHALKYLKREFFAKDYTYRKTESFLRIGQILTKEAYDLQAELLERFHQRRRFKKSITWKDKDVKVSKSELEVIIQKAMDFIDFFALEVVKRDIRGFLQISDLGNRAIFSLHVGRIEAPLSGFGKDYTVYLIKKDGLWFIVGYGTGFWIS